MSPKEKKIKPKRVKGKVKAKKAPVVEKPVAPKKEVVKADPKKEAVKNFDAKIAKRLKESIYSKECPVQHFHGSGIEVQLELAKEAAKQLIIDKHWEVETFTDSKGVITHAIFVLPETEK